MWGAAYNSPVPGGDYILGVGGKLSTLQNGSANLSGTTYYEETTASLTVGTCFMASQKCDGTNAGHKLRKNGTTVPLTNAYSANPGTFTKAATAYGIGAGNTGTDRGRFDICEVLHFPYALSDAECGRVENYLLQKWGIS